MSNDDTSVGITSAEGYDRFSSGAPNRRELAEYETIYANDKAKRLVGLRPAALLADGKGSDQAEGRDFGPGPAEKEFDGTMSLVAALAQPQPTCPYSANTAHITSGASDDEPTQYGHI